MEFAKIKEKYERELKQIEENIQVYESSDNHELRIASRTLKVKVEELHIIIDALKKQIPQKAKKYTDYRDGYGCPVCHNVGRLDYCSACGQKLYY